MKPESYYKQRKAVYNPEQDPFHDYRKDEFDEAVYLQIIKARERGGHPKKAFLDNVLDIQKESVMRAVKYVGYKYLGEYTYLEVFSPQSMKEAKEEKHYEESRQLKQQFDEVQAQLSEMQMLIFNMANMMNQQSKSVKSA